MTTTTTTRKLPAVPTGTEILLKARDSHRFAAKECLSYASAAHTAAEAAEHADRAAWNFRAVAAAEALLVELDAMRSARPATTAASPEVCLGVNAEAAVRAAYNQLVRQTGFPAVMMSALQKQSGESLEVVHALARKLHQTGTGVLSLGDWSLATEEQRAAVLVNEATGERFLQLRFL